jgi:two-component system sensor histidine kinase MtrB
MPGRGFRGRLVITIVALVALTSAVLGVGSYLFVGFSLRDQQLSEARRQAEFNLVVLAAEALPDTVTREALVASDLDEAFRRRGAETVVDFGQGEPYVSSLAVTDALGRLSPELTGIVRGGRELGYQRLTIDGEPYLVIGGRRPPGGPDFYFFYSAREVEDAILRLGQASLAGGLLLVLLAALAGGAVARGVLRPVRAASTAARRIERGDLGARVPAGAQDEFGAWAQAFNRMAASLESTVDDLREAQVRQRRFVSDVSHELRTPLTSLVSAAGLLREHLDAMPPDGRRVGELLIGDIARLRVLVDELLEISRFDAEAEELAPSEFDLGAFLRAVVAARLPDARLHVPSGDLRLRLDRRRLERVVGNLLDNARSHGGGREVELEAQLDPRELLIAVADRGPGVPVEDLPRLFDRFYKADPSRHGTGSGLGLAIAREHARLLGGDLIAAARVGGGLRFELRLPVTGSLPAGDHAVTAEVEAAAHQSPRTEPST